MLLICMYTHSTSHTATILCRVTQARYLSQLSQSTAEMYQPGVTHSYFAVTPSLPA